MQKFVSIILIAFVVLLGKNAMSQCTASGYANGSTFANDASTGSLAFGTPANAKNNDGSYASATATAVLLTLSNTNYLKATNFGFNLPATSVVCGVEVSVVKKASGLNIVAYVNDNTVKLFINGSITGNNNASATHWGTSNATTTYGSPTDSWGINPATLNYSNVNSSAFGVVFSANINGLAGLGTAANIDQVQVNVYYDITPLALGLESFTAIKNNGSCFLSWAVNRDNSYNNFVVQRSSDLNNWENIANIKAEQNQQQYLFDDEKLLAGNNYYRLQIINASGETSYSNISLVSGEQNEPARIYPNPASDNFNIAARPTTHNIQIRDEYGRIVKSLKISSPTDHIKIQIADLKSGAYFVQIDHSVLKLWKK
ncbi:MAG TPA: T9SS type A sorting domain-containing protein [Puia sp.]|nr:T9SS type A sorting domain-containing protein [Puia sp.]